MKKRSASTAWTAIRNFFNSKPSKKLFTRNEMLLFLKDYNRTAKIPMKPETVEAYRLLLTSSGYLTKAEAGVYRKLKKIPERFSATEARKKAYPSKIKTHKQLKTFNTFTQPMMLSKALNRVLLMNSSTQVPAVATRVDVVKKLWQYILLNELLDQKNPRRIVLNEALRPIFDPKKTGLESIGLFDITRLVGKELTPVKDGGK